MILTVTPAPAVDWTIELDQFEFGAVNRFRRSQREASGKGVNVSAALQAAGIPTRAVLPAGGPGGGELRDDLAARGLDAVLVPSSVPTRTNITLVIDGLGAGTKVNQSPQQLTEADRAALLAATESAIADLPAGSIVVTAGSAASAGQTSVHCEVVALTRAAGLIPVVDTSEPHLSAVLALGPALIKPNATELASLVGEPLATVADVVAACRLALRRGPGAVLASLGADGALYVDDDDAWHAEVGGSPVRVRNTVGAGDALLAGAVSAWRRPVPELLRTAVAWGASAVQSATTLFTLDDSLAPRVVVRPAHEVAGRVLTEPVPAG